MQILAGQPDHRRNQPGQLRPPGIGGVVVDIARHRRQQRVRAGRAIAPPLPGQIRRQLHETRARARAAVLAPRQHRDQLGRTSLVTRHRHLHRIRGPGPASLRLQRARPHGPRARSGPADDVARHEPCPPAPAGRRNHAAAPGTDRPPMRQNARSRTARTSSSYTSATTQIGGSGTYAVAMLDNGACGQAAWKCHRPRRRWVPRDRDGALVVRGCAGSGSIPAWSG